MDWSIRWRRRGDKAFKSKYILLTVAFFCVTDCALVLGELILDLHKVKDTLETSERVIYEFKKTLSQTYPAHIVDAEEADIRDIFDLITRSRIIWQHRPIPSTTPLTNDTSTTTTNLTMTISTDNTPSRLLPSDFSHLSSSSSSSSSSLLSSGHRPPSRKGGGSSSVVMTSVPSTTKTTTTTTTKEQRSRGSGSVISVRKRRSTAGSGSRDREETEVVLVYQEGGGGGGDGSGGSAGGGGGRWEEGEEAQEEDKEEEGARSVWRGHGHTGGHGGGKGTEEHHSVEEEVAHILHFISVTLMAILVVESILKAVCAGLPFFKRKLETFDFFIVIVSFIVDIVFMQILPRFKIQDFVFILAFLLPWRVIRVVNSLVVAVQDHEHFRLKMMYSRKKKIQNSLRETEVKLQLFRAQCCALKRLCLNEGVDEARIEDIVQLDEYVVNKTGKSKCKVKIDNSSVILLDKCDFPRMSPRPSLSSLWEKRRSIQVDLCSHGASGGGGGGFFKRNGHMLTVEEAMGREGKKGKGARKSSFSFSNGPFSSLFGSPKDHHSPEVLRVRRAGSQGQICEAIKRDFLGVERVKRGGSHHQLCQVTVTNEMGGVTSPVFQDEAGGAKGRGASADEPSQQQGKPGSLRDVVGVASSAAVSDSTLLRRDGDEAGGGSSCGLSRGPASSQSAPVLCADKWTQIGGWDGGEFRGGDTGDHRDHHSTGDSRGGRVIGDNNSGRREEPTTKAVRDLHLRGSSSGGSPTTTPFISGQVVVGHAGSPPSPAPSALSLSILSPRGGLVISPRQHRSASLPGSSGGSLGVLDTLLEDPLPPSPVQRQHRASSLGPPGSMHSITECTPSVTQTPLLPAGGTSQGGGRGIGGGGPEEQQQHQQRHQQDQQQQQNQRPERADPSRNASVRGDGGSGRGGGGGGGDVQRETTADVSHKRSLPGPLALERSSSAVEEGKPPPVMVNVGEPEVKGWYLGDDDTPTSTCCPPPDPRPRSQSDSRAVDAARWGQPGDWFQKNRADDTPALAAVSSAAVIAPSSSSSSSPPSSSFSSSLKEADGPRHNACRPAAERLARAEEVPTCPPGTRPSPVSSSRHQRVCDDATSVQGDTQPDSRSRSGDDDTSDSVVADRSPRDAITVVTSSLSVDDDSTTTTTDGAVMKTPAEAKKQKDGRNIQR